MKISNKLNLLLAVITIGVIVVGCGGNSEIVKGETLSWNKLDDHSLAGKTVTIEGYPELPFLMMNENERSTVNMTARMNQYGGGMVILHILDGDDENTLAKLPSEYEQSDLVIHDNKGEKVMYGGKIRVTGKASIENDKYHIEVMSIEKMDATVDYTKLGAVRLTDTSDLEALDKKLVYAEGIIFVSDEQSNGIRLEIFMEDTTLPYELLCKVKYGPLNNQADELPDGYTDEDLVIRDNNGKVVGEGSIVRVYGMYYVDKEMIAVEQVVALE